MAKENFVSLDEIPEMNEDEKKFLNFNGILKGYFDFEKKEFVTKKESCSAIFRGRGASSRGWYSRDCSTCTRRFHT